MLDLTRTHIEIQALLGWVECCLRFRSSIHLKISDTFKKMHHCVSAVENSIFYVM